MGLSRLFLRTRTRPRAAGQKEEHEEDVINSHISMKRIHLLALAFLCLSGDQASQAADRPNVLMIIVDDMNDWVGCLGGHPDVKTPHIDRLAKRGTLFTNAHVAAPVCNPSRVATMTGRLPSSTGVYDNRPVWHEAMRGVTSIPRHFKVNGYRVVGGGKVNHHMPGFNRRSDWHEYFDQVFDNHYQDQLARGLDVTGFQWPKGFPLNRLPAVNSFSRPPKNAKEFDWGAWDKMDREMGDGQMVEWAAEFLAHPPEKPFFLAAGIYRPHLPFYAPRKYFEMYPPDKITLPPTKADDLDDLPEAGKEMAAIRRGDYELVMKSGKYRELLQAYLASVSFGDALVGRLLDALDASPAAKNTIIVFWSDHGWHLGEKRHLHKFTLWERSTRIPFIVVAPGVTHPGIRSGKPVGTIDIFPTLNELCDLPSVDGLDGASLMPMLRNPALDRKRPALITHGQGNHALRTERWRYIRYTNGDEELYDHARDPNEWTNLANKPELASVKSELTKWLPNTDAVPLKRKKKQ
jgi:arylsulfatase A-like enzyme